MTAAFVLTVVVRHVTSLRFILTETDLENVPFLFRLGPRQLSAIVSAKPKVTRLAACCLAIRLEGY